ncbi:hypothetical protein [Baekduia sp. Peel2402]|uniref:hypothetical protein n=1 Tax=Baekduia sp. Peel2402 TaxID=3458296 RepID=UPI00403EEC37
MLSHRLLKTTLSAAPVLAIAVALPAPAGAAARVVSCSTYSDYPNVRISSARGLSCATARDIMKAYRGEISKTFTAPRGFTCRQVSGVPEGGQWRCTRRSQAFRFEFKD